jgi:hypothetical protein
VRKLVVLGACLVAVGCGSDDEAGKPAAQILAKTDPAPVVTTPSEGGVIEDTPVEAPAAKKKASAKKRSSSSSSSKGSSGSGAKGSSDPVTAPNSKGPYGPAEVKAPAAKKTSPARGEIESRVKTYLKAIATANGKRACDQMTAAGQKALAKKIATIAPETQGAACREAIVLYQGAYGDAIKQPRVTSVRVSGKTATAIGPLKQVAKLQQQGGRWLITEYGQ